MNKIIFFSLLILSISAMAADDEDVIEANSTPVVVSTESTREDGKDFNAYKGHWLTSFGFESGKYETPWEYRGEHKNLRPSDQQLTGGRLGVGREIYIGKGLMTTTKVEGYYIGTLFTSAQNAGPEDSNIEFAYTKKVGNLWGVDVSQSVSWLHEMKTRNPILGEWTYLTVEPFVEAGIGKASAYQRINYKYELQTTNESYRHSVSDDLTNAKLAAGINFTSRQGYFLYLKVTQNRYDVTNRKLAGAKRQDGETSETSLKGSDKNVDIDAITVYALGGGYKF